MCRPDNVNKNVSLFESNYHVVVVVGNKFCFFWCCFEKQLEWNIMRNIVQCKQLIMFQNKTKHKKVSLHAALMCIINNIIRVSTPLLLLQTHTHTHEK